MQYFFLGAAVVCNIVANIGMKLAAQQGFDFSADSPIEFFKRNWITIASLMLYALNALFYYLSLKHLPLSVVYPVIITLGFAAINIFAFLWLKEQITAWQIVGYAFVLIGTALILLFGAKTS